MKNLLKFHKRTFSICNLSKGVILSVFFILAFSFTAMSQNGSGFGIKGGVNYNANGDYFNSISNTFEDPTRAVGYHVGIFGKIGDKLYLKPELIYTKTTSEYDSGDFKLQRIDAPVLVGLKIIGPVSVFGGPAFQYILDSDFDNARIGNVENDFTVGLNFGIGLNFNNLGIDLRYERGFTENEASIILNNSSINVDRLDTRPEQLILSLSIKL
ncbi:outer membrane beta-barrel protein [Lacinutrix chionoecetis]